MTRVGKGEEETGRIAELIKECIMDKRTVKEEVNRFRSEFQDVRYSCDVTKQGDQQPIILAELKN